MRQYIESILADFDFPEESVPVLLDAYDKLSERSEFKEIFKNFYSEVTMPDHRAALAKCKQNRAILTPVCEEAGINLFTSSAVLYICLYPSLKEACKMWNWTDDMYRRAMVDLRCKLSECRGNYGVWGVSVDSWLAYIYAGVINSIGRLQFMYHDYEDEGDVTIAGHTLSSGGKFIDIHIPASNEPFDEKSRLELYDKAYRYFSELYNAETCFFGCKSWLLFEYNSEILNPKSNIVSFLNEFKLIHSENYPDPRRDMWRIFGGVANAAPFETLPENSSLQRGYKKWLMDGNFPGEGKGYFLYDNINKKIINA